MNWKEFGSSHGLITVIFWYLPIGAEENDKTPQSVFPMPQQDSKQAPPPPPPPPNKSQSINLTPTCSVTCVTFLSEVTRILKNKHMSYYTDNVILDNRKTCRNVFNKLLVVLHLRKLGSKNQSCTNMTTWQTERRKAANCKDCISMAFSVDANSVPENFLFSCCTNRSITEAESMGCVSSRMTRFDVTSRSTPVVQCPPSSWCSKLCGLK